MAIIIIFAIFTILNVTIPLIKVVLKSVSCKQQ